MNKNKELAKNTLIIFIGKFCTQFVSFLLVPIYTYYLISSDYGYVDLIQTYVSLLAPMIILRFDSAIFRFLIDFRNNENKKNEIISSSVILISFQILIVTIIFFIVNSFLHFDYYLAIILNIVFVSISSYLLQLIRGIGKNIEYSIASIISGIITIVLNIILIICFKYNASSILYTSAIANILCSLYLILKNKLYKYLNIKFYNKKVLKEMLNYSLPMIPDGLSWWVVNVSDRTIISFLINTSANGIYAVSSKFSNILSSIFQIFNMSWQESASMHINDDDKDDFFSNVVSKTYYIFYTLCLGIMICMPFIIKYLIGNEYKSAYYYIPILLLGNLFNAIANTLGGIYIAKKETKKVAKTTMIAAFINIIINLIFIKFIGLYAAAISTLIAYIVVALYRWIDTKKYINITINTRKFIVSLIIYLIGATIYYFNNNVLNLINFVVIILYLLFINKDIIKIILKKVRRVK